MVVNVVAAENIAAPRAAPSSNTGLSRYGTDTGCGCAHRIRRAPCPALQKIEQGHELVLSRRFAEAESCFREALAQEPDWSMPHNNLGWALQAQGRNEEAVTSYKEALRCNPGLELAQTNLAHLLANLYAHIGKHHEAHLMWLHIARRHPEDYLVLDQLISTALRMHDLPNAGHWATRYADITRSRSLTDEVIPMPRLTRGKLRHDLEQYHYLRERELIGPEFDGVMESYETMLRALRENDEPLLERLSRTPQIRSTYGRNAHHGATPRLPGNALSFSESTLRAERQYQESELGIVVIDDFLSTETLALLQEFCLESTIWHHNHYSYDRLGSFFRDGFNCPLLLQIAEEIRAVFPTIIGTTHPLLQMWGYKYRHNQPETHPHADFAAVNVNFWITPDAANQNPDSSGLIIYDIEAPMDWDFDTYNRQGDKISAFLQEHGAKRINIPYRCNRAVIFNSDLFHTTAPLAFRPGYANQRINVTMLYGERETATR
jgi:tetratricopeptide (TPR) repeat protein